MDFQIIIVAVIIAAALFYVGRMLLKKVRATGKGSSCEIDCGCGSKSKNVFAPTRRN
jgi:hypothetical protein